MTRLQRTMLRALPVADRRPDVEDGDTTIEVAAVKVAMLRAGRLWSNADQDKACEVARQLILDGHYTPRSLRD